MNKQVLHEALDKMIDEAKDRNIGLDCIDIDLISMSASDNDDEPLIETYHTINCELTTDSSGETTIEEMYYEHEIFVDSKSSHRVRNQII